MIEYNEQTSQDYTKGYDPFKLDSYYKEGNYYKKGESQMPPDMEFAFDAKFAGISMQDETVQEIKDMFAKFQPLGTNLIDPTSILRVFKLYNMKVQSPSMYSMIEWIVQAREKEGKVEGLTFD